jgi:FixJ family two-component response regulator
MRIKAKGMGSADAFGHQFGVSPNPNTTPIVFAVDGDVSVLASLERSIHCEGWQPKTFESAREFITQPRPFVPSCLVLVLSPSNDLETQKQIARERPETPIIVISSQGDIPTAVQAMKAGAVDLLVKPFNNDALLDAIRQSLERSRAVIGHEVTVKMLKERYASLSRREREVMTLVVQGRLNKLIANELGISEITVKAHRGSVMRKMDAESLPALVHMAATLGLALCMLRVRFIENTRPRSARPAAVLHPAY